MQSLTVVGSPSNSNVLRASLPRAAVVSCMSWDVVYYLAFDRYVDTRMQNRERHSAAPITAPAMYVPRKCVCGSTTYAGVGNSGKRVNESL